MTCIVYRKNVQLKSLNGLEINILRIQMNIAAKKFKCGAFCLFTPQKETLGPSSAVTMESPMLTKTGPAKLHCFPFTINMVIRLTGLALMYIFFLILVNLEIIRMENSNNNNNNCGNTSPARHLNETSDSGVSPSSVTHNT